MLRVLPSGTTLATVALTLKHAIIPPCDIHGAADWMLRGCGLDGWDAPDARMVWRAHGFILCPWVPEEREGDCGLYDLEGLRVFYKPQPSDAEDCAELAHEGGHYAYEGACDVGLTCHDERLAHQMSLALMMPRGPFESRLRAYRGDLGRLFGHYPLVPRRFVVEYAGYFIGLLLHVAQAVDARAMAHGRTVPGRRCRSRRYAAVC
jgi:hypothetical protein